MTSKKQQARAYSTFTIVSNVCLFEFFVFLSRKLDLFYQMVCSKFF